MDHPLPHLGRVLRDTLAHHRKKLANLQVCRYGNPECIHTIMLHIWTASGMYASLLTTAHATLYILGWQLVYFSHACRHPHSPRSQVGCKMAALWYLPPCGVPSLGSHSTIQGRKPRRLHAGLAEQVDLQPGRTGDPPPHLADGIGGSSPLW